MFSKADINRILRTLMIALSAVFLFTACTTGTADDAKRTAVPKCGTGNCGDDMEQEQVDCWQRAIIDNLYDIMGSTTADMYTKITNGALTFMMVAFALWFAFRLLAHVSSFVEENPAEVWTEVLRKLALCFTCGIIASSPNLMLGVLNMTVFPVYGAFLEFGSEILARASDNVYNHAPSLGDVARIPGRMTDALYLGLTDFSGVANDIIAQTDLDKTSLILFGKTITWWNSGDPIICRAGGMDNATLEGFPEMPKEMMGCLICALNRRLNLGFSLSFEIISEPGLTATLVGLMVLVCFTIVKWGFVFYLVDTIFKFTVMIVAMPILIMGYAFQYTRSWLGTGIKTILNSAAFMMFIAVIIAMTLTAIETLIIDNPNIFNPEGENIQTTFREFSVPFMCLMMICFLIASSVGVASALADNLVGGSANSEFAKKAQTVLKWLVDGVLALVTGGSSMAIQKSVKGAKMMAKAQKAMQKVNKLAGRD